jgi:hypothetical protein
VPTLNEGQPEVEGAASGGTGQLLITFARGANRLEKLNVTVISANPLGVPIPKAFPIAAGGSAAAVDADLQSNSPTLMIGFENWTGVLTNPTSVTLRIEITVKTSSI